MDALFSLAASVAAALAVAATAISARVVAGLIVSARSAAASAIAASTVAAPGVLPFALHARKPGRRIVCILRRCQSLIRRGFQPDRIFSAAHRRCLPSLILYTCLCLVPVPVLAGEVLDINRASAEELQTLKGVGPAMAARMLAARAERPFESLDDVAARVQGAGPRRLQQWREAGLVVRPGTPSNRDVRTVSNRRAAPRGVEMLVGQPVPVPAASSGPVPDAGSRTQGRRRASKMNGQRAAGHRMDRTGAIREDRTDRAGAAREDRATRKGAAREGRMGRKGVTRAGQVDRAGATREGWMDREGAAREARTNRADVPPDAHQRPSAAAGCSSASRTRGRSGHRSGAGRRAGRRAGQVLSSQASMLDTGPMFECRSLFDAKTRLGAGRS